MGKRRCDDSLGMRLCVNPNINFKSVDNIIGTDCARRGSSKDELDDENDNADEGVQDCAWRNRAKCVL